MGLLYPSGRSRVQVIELKDLGGDRVTQPFSDVTERLLITPLGMGALTDICPA